MSPPPPPLPPPAKKRSRNTSHGPMLRSHDKKPRRSTTPVLLPTTVTSLRTTRPSRGATKTTAPPTLPSHLPRANDEFTPPPPPMATRSRTAQQQRAGVHHHTPTTHVPPVNVTPRTTTTTTTTTIQPTPSIALLQRSRNRSPPSQCSFYTDPALGVVPPPLPPGVVHLQTLSIRRSYNPSPNRRPRDPPHDGASGEDYLTTYGLDYLHYLQQKQQPKQLVRATTRPWGPPFPVTTTTTNTTHMTSSPRTNPNGNDDRNTSLSSTTAPPPRVITTTRAVESDLTISPTDTATTTTMTPLTNVSLAPSLPRSTTSADPVAHFTPAVQSSSSVTLRHQPLLTPRMRRTLVVWMVEVCQEFDLSDATYHLSVTLVDELLSKNPFPIRREQFQAVGCVCIWIASKLGDVKPPSRSELCYISDFSVSDGQMLRMEQHICTLLEFRLQRVTPFHLLPLYLRACSVTADAYDPTDETIASMVKYLLELSRTSYRLTQERPDLLTAACVYLARATLGINPDQPREDWYWTKTLEHYTGYKTNDMVHVIIIIYMIRMASETSPVAGVGGCPLYHKYATREHHYASQNIPPRLEYLRLPLSGIDYDKYMEPLMNEQDYFVHLPSMLM